MAPVIASARSEATKAAKLATRSTASADHGVSVLKQHLHPFRDCRRERGHAGVTPRDQRVATSIEERPCGCPCLPFSRCC
jgi:hypothetical protein